MYLHHSPGLQYYCVYINMILWNYCVKINYCCMGLIIFAFSLIILSNPVTFSWRTGAENSMAYNSDSSSSSSPPHLQATTTHGGGHHMQQQAPPSATSASSVPVTPYLSQVCNYGPIFASSAYAHHNYSPFHGYDR